MPTLSTTAIDGGAIAASAAMLPGWRADISSTRKSVSRGGAQHRPRVAELVVERPGRGHHLAQRAQHRGDQVLGGRLARRAGDPDDRQPAGDQFGGHRRGQLGQRGQHRGAGAVGVVLEHPGLGVGGRRRRHDDRRHPDRARGQHRRPHPPPTAAAAKSWPSERAPGSARNSPPGVTARESNSTVPVTRSPAASAGRDVGQLGRRRSRRSGRRSASIIGCSPDGSQGGGQFVAVVERAGSARRRSARSRAPCRRSRTTSPRAGPADGVVDGVAAVADLDHLGRAVGRAAPARMAARIAAGSSSRGLSSVTTTRSASSAATCPIGSRLPGSRLPPAPNTTASRRAGPAQRLQHRPQCAGLVGVVDDGQEVLAAVDRLEPAGHRGRRAGPGDGLLG